MFLAESVLLIINISAEINKNIAIEVSVFTTTDISWYFTLPCLDVYSGKSQNKKYVLKFLVQSRKWVHQKPTNQPTLN